MYITQPHFGTLYVITHRYRRRMKIYIPLSCIEFSRCPLEESPGVHFSCVDMSQQLATPLSSVIRVYRKKRQHAMTQQSVGMQHFTFFQKNYKQEVSWSSSGGARLALHTLLKYVVFFPLVLQAIVDFWQEMQYVRELLIFTAQSLSEFHSHFLPVRSFIGQWFAFLWLQGCLLSNIFLLWRKP